MGTVTEKLQKIMSSKEAIRTAIEAKGIPCTADTPLVQFAEKISAISGGGISFAACLPPYGKIDAESEMRFVNYEKANVAVTEG